MAEESLPRHTRKNIIPPRDVEEVGHWDRPIQVMRSLWEMIDILLQIIMSLEGAVFLSIRVIWNLLQKWISTKRVSKTTIWPQNHQENLSLKTLIPRSREMKTWNTNNRQSQENQLQSRMLIKQAVLVANRRLTTSMRSLSIDLNRKRKKKTQQRSSQNNPTISTKLIRRRIRIMSLQMTASRTKFSRTQFNRLRKLIRKNNSPLRWPNNSKIKTLDKNRSMRLLWIFRASFPTSACRLTKTRRIRVDFSMIQVQKVRKKKTKVEITLTTRGTMRAMITTIVFSAAETCLTNEEAPILTSASIKRLWTKLISSPYSICSDRVQGFLSTTSSRSTRHSMMEKARANMKPNKETSSSRHLRWIPKTIRNRRIQGPVYTQRVLLTWGRELWMPVLHTSLHRRLNSNRRVPPLSSSRSLATFQYQSSSRSRGNRRWKISILNKHKSWRSKPERRGTGKWMQLRPRNEEWNR